MGLIDIELFDQWSFDFSTNDKEINNAKSKFCYYCHIHLQKGYTYIIDNLKKAGLLVEGYKLICCYCKLLKKYGLLELRESMSRINYFSNEDILKIEFSFAHRMPNIEIEWHRMCFNIHDYSKVKWD